LNTTTNSILLKRKIINLRTNSRYKLTTYNENMPTNMTYYKCDGMKLKCSKYHAFKSVMLTTPSEAWILLNR